MNVAGVTLNQSGATLSVGETLQLVASVSPTDATDPVVTWATSDEGIATISADGLVTAIDYGEAEITVTATTPTQTTPRSATCTITVSPTIYLLTTSNNVPQLWVNGESQWSITDGSIYDTSYGEMTVTGSDVYLPMNIYSSDTYSYFAAYYKNGVGTQVETSASYAYNMTVDGSDTYVVGYMTDPATYNSTAYMWKNGAATQLSTRGSYAYGVAVANGNVYISGQQRQETGWQSEAVLWTNGTVQTLNTYGSADKIHVNGSDVYVLGYAYDDVNYRTVYTVWKNGAELYQIPYEGYSAQVNSLVVAPDGKLYVVGQASITDSSTGNSKSMAVVWVDNVQYVIGEAGRVSEARDIAIFNNDVYIVGNYDVGSEIGLSSSVYSPVVWKNGGEIPSIELGSWQSARALGIAVQE
jgi:hypothetical protein